GRGGWVGAVWPERVDRVGRRASHAPACGGLCCCEYGVRGPARPPADIARRSARSLASRARPRDAFARETFALPREAARAKARELFARFPKAAYMTEIESWRVLPGDRIEFTVRRLPSAD